MADIEEMPAKPNSLKAKAEAASKGPYYDPDKDINQIVDLVVKKVKSGMDLEDALKPYRTDGERVEGFTGGIITRLQGLGYDIELDPKAKS